MMSRVLLAQKYLPPIMGKLTLPQFMAENIQKNTKVFHQEKHCNKIEQHSMSRTATVI
jgi:hypothetical protein